MPQSLQIVHTTHLNFKSLLGQHLKKKLEKFFPTAISYFINPSDAIAHLPLLGRVHDEEVVETLRALSRQMPHCFVDVGANIGLVSIALAKQFHHIICVEPNPIVCNVLKTNLSLNLDRFTVHEVGLGQQAQTLSLHIPRHNMGGAFIKEGNQYSQSDLANKDGFQNFDEKNYLVQKIQIKPSVDFWNELIAQQPETLLIKFDVEGQEESLIESLLDCYGAYFRAEKIAFVFESHTSELPAALAKRMAIFGYEVRNMRLRSWPSARNALLRRMLKLFFGQRTELLFCNLDMPSQSAYRNYLCAPARLLLQEK